MSPSLWALPALLLLACGDKDTDTGADGGAASDGGATDGGSADGGAPDGGAEDGGAPDGGAEDGGAADGGAEDGGGTGDGGSTSGGAPILWGEAGVGLHAERCDADADHVYVFGYVEGELELGGTATVTRGKDLLVARFSKDGALDWAGSLGTAGSDEYLGDVGAAPDGGMVIASFAIEDIDTDPGPGTSTVSLSGGDSISYVTRLDATGAHQWTAGFTGTARVEAYDVAVDATGGVVTAGWAILGTVDLDPGPATLIATADGYDGWVVSLDADGALRWAGLLDAPPYPGEATPLRVLVDDAGSAYVVGYFTGEVDFAPVSGGAIADAGELNQAFVVKLDTAGEVSWLSTFGTAANTLPYAAQLGADGKLWLGGFFDADTDVDPGPGALTLSNAGQYDVFVMALDAEDGSLVQADSFGSASHELGYDLVVSDAGAFAIRGQAAGVVDVDWTDGVYELTGTDAWPTFLGTWDGDGSTRWAELAEARVSHIVDDGPDAWACGGLSGTQDVAFGGDEELLTAIGVQDLLLRRISLD